MTYEFNHSISRAVELEKEWNRTGFSFISTDLDTSLTFANLAQDAGDDAGKRERNIVNARRGLQSVVYFLRRFDDKSISEPELKVIVAKLELLRSKLKQLGVDVERV